MFHPRAALLAGAVALALAGGARAGEVKAAPACCKRPVTASYYVGPNTCCYDPCCERVGPVRRLLRRIFRPCCAPPRVVAPVVAVTPPPPPVALPPSAVPPADLGRPIAPPPGVGPVGREAPPPISPTAAPPVRADRIASRGGVQATVVSRSSKPVPNGKVALIHADKADLRHQLAADADGRITAQLEGGTWLVYTRDGDGRYVYRGKLTVREKETVRAKLLGE